MKLRLKFLLLKTLVLFSVKLFAQTEVGIGLVSINFDEQTVVHFYDNAQDQQPIRTLNFLDDPSTNSWNIFDLDFHKTWLNPEIIWLDYAQFVFRCTSVSDNWLQVIINNETGEQLWIKRSESIEFETWESFLKGMFMITRLETNSQAIRVLPSGNAEEIIYTSNDCFQVKSMKGDWIEIFNSENCDDDEVNSKEKISSGWIKWRDQNNLLIIYYPTS